MPCTVPFEEVVKRISYANSELVLGNSREKAMQLLKEIASHFYFCLEKGGEDKISVKAVHNRKTIRVDIQVEKSRTNDLWLVTMTPHL